jgi:putative transcriptional regulator
MAESDLAPAFLVAMNQLWDPNFRGSVVLMLHHDEQGAVGLVINRITDLPMASLCETFGLTWRGAPEMRVDWGGPVQPELGWMLLGEGNPEGPEVESLTEGIRYTRSNDVLREVAENPPRHLRMFLGYAGWGPGQLERELAQGAWLVAPASARLVFEGRRDRLWDDAVRSLGIEPATLVQTQGVN